MENSAGCNYKGTKWNTNNKGYKAINFKSDEITERWNSYTGNSGRGRTIHDLDLEELETAIVEVAINKNEAYLLNYSKYELKILRNMVMARQGYRFPDGELKNYFNTKSWYDGYIEDQNQIILNDNERVFVETIKKHEK